MLVPDQCGLIWSDQLSKMGVSSFLHSPEKEEFGDFLPGKN